jgi:Arc/MetJ-type ribon-helix-helix transcriptional regulator
MTVKMTPEMEKLVEEKLQEGAFDSPEEVILAGLLSLGRSDEEDYDAPEHLRVKSREQIVRLLREGLSDTGKRYTEADMRKMRNELIERGQVSKGS